MKKRAYLEIRSQKSVGSSAKKFGGPNTYVAVQIVPEGQIPLKYLNKYVAAKRGIEIKYFGEGYKGYTGPRSSLGKALKAGHDFVLAYNRGQIV